MSASLIIRRCASLSEARICVGLLKSRGFLAEIDNAAHAELDWGSIPALGGVAIRVPRSQFEPAKREIIDAIEHADEALIDEFEADYDDRVDMGRRRWRAWTMLLISTGIFNLIFGYILAMILNRLPRDWFPAPPEATQYFGIPIETHLTPPTLAWDGIIFMLLIALFLVWEIGSVTRSRSTEDV